MGVVLAGVECKWRATHPQQDEFTLERCRAAFAYARQSQQQFRGHNLCWNVPQYNPDWLNDMRSGSADAMRAALTEHVQTVMRGVAQDGYVYAWDVVNEPIGCVGTPCSLNGSHWYGATGTWAQKVPDYPDIAFRAAREAIGPPPHGPKLILSDFDIIANNPEKLGAVLELVSGMQKRGVPIDGIACQTHAKLSRVTRGRADSMASVEQYIAEANETMSKIAAMGLDVHVSEMNVACNIHPGCGNATLGEPPTAARVAMQSRVFAGILANCLSQPRCTTFEMWNFIDGHEASVISQPWAEVFDEHYRPKPQFSALIDVLKGAASL